MNAISAWDESVSVRVDVSRRMTTRARWSTTNPCRCVDGRYRHSPVVVRGVREAGVGTLAGAGLVRIWVGTVPPRQAPSNEQPAAAAAQDVRRVLRIMERRGESPRPVSRVLSKHKALRTVISLGMRSPTFSSGLPAASLSKRTASRRLFGLAPAGVCRAVRVATDAVGSYPTFSPLPTLSRGRFVFCGTVRHRANGAQALPGSLSMEPGLSSKRESSFRVATVRPRESPDRIVLSSEALCSG